jgi:hypothetical protein
MGAVRHLEGVRGYSALCLEADRRAVYLDIAAFIKRHDEAYIELIQRDNEPARG